MTRESVCYVQYIYNFPPRIFNPQLVESMDGKPTDLKGQLYTQYKMETDSTSIHTLNHEVIIKSGNRDTIILPIL
jgi:hypothetical protein